MSIIDLRSQRSLIELYDNEQKEASKYRSLFEQFNNYDSMIKENEQKQQDINDALALIDQYHKEQMQQAKRCANEELNQIITSLSRYNIICEISYKLFGSMKGRIEIIPKNKQELIDYITHTFINRISSVDPSYSHVEKFMSKDRFIVVIAELITSNEPLPYPISQHEYNVLLIHHTINTIGTSSTSLTYDELKRFIDELYLAITTKWTNCDSPLYTSCVYSNEKLRNLRKIIIETSDDKFINDVNMYAALICNYNGLYKRFLYSVQGCWEAIESLYEMRHNKTIITQYPELFNKLERNDKNKLSRISTSLNHELYQTKQYNKELKQQLASIEPKRIKCQTINQHLDIIDELKQTINDKVEDMPDIINLSKLIIHINELRNELN